MQWIDSSLNIPNKNDDFLHGQRTFPFEEVDYFFILVSIFRVFSSVPTGSLRDWFVRAPAVFLNFFWVFSSAGSERLPYKQEVRGSIP